MEELGYTVSWLSKKADMYKDKISALLSGKVEWRITSLKSVLESLRMQPEDVISGSDLEHYHRELKFYKDNGGE